jgi:phage-related protein
MLDVIFFRTLRGNEPVRVWLSNFGEEDGNIIDIDIRTAAEHWPQVLRTSLVKKMPGEEHLWEIRSRISEGKRNARILFTVEGRRMILLHGFIKKSRRTPRKDLRLARKRKDLSRSGSVP